MRNTVLSLLALAFVLLWPSTVLAQQGGEGPATPPDPADAAAIYEVRCANCHGAAAQGGGPQAVQAGLAMPDLSDRSVLRTTTPARWFEIISDGIDGKAMPPFGESSSNPLSEAERWNLVYLLYTFGTPRQQVDMGKALYERSCAECHASDGTGSGEVAGFSDLAAMAQRSQTDLFTAIKDTTIEGHSLGLEDVEAWTLADYVRTFTYDYAPPPASDTAAGSAAPVAASPFAEGAGVISGQVRNGTPGAAPPAGVEIQLRAFDTNASFMDAITTTVASDGSFRFEDIDPAVPVQLEPRVVYQGVSYFGDLESAISLSPEQPEADVNITVYETTTDPSDLRIERLHVVFDMAPEQAQVAELYILSNDGDRAFVGTAEQGTLHLTIPQGALNFQPGGDPNRFITLADGLADTIPIPPGRGTAESVLVYTLPYDGGLELSRPMPYDAQTINIFVPADAGVEVSGDTVRAGGPFQAQGMALDTYLVDNLAAGEQLRFRLSGDFEGSAAAGAGSTGSSSHSLSQENDTLSLVTGGVVLAGTLALAYLYWQGHLDWGLRLTSQDREAALIASIADLDDQYQAGRLDEPSYRAQRTRLKHRLLELMEPEE